MGAEPGASHARVCPTELPRERVAPPNNTLRLARQCSTPCGHGILRGFPVLPTGAADRRRQLSAISVMRQERRA